MRLVDTGDNTEKGGRAPTPPSHKAYAHPSEGQKKENGRKNNHTQFSYATGPVIYNL